MMHVNAIACVKIGVCPLYWGTCVGNQTDDYEIPELYRKFQERKHGPRMLMSLPKNGAKTHSCLVKQTFLVGIS